MIVITIFIIGYLAIVFEGTLKLNKTISALFMATLIWIALSVGFTNGWYQIINELGQTFNFLTGGPQAVDGFHDTLLGHLATTCEILIFLIGAMTIVEIIEMNRGFVILKRLVNTQSKRKLLWIVGLLGFFLSAVIDNLTATIILVSLIRKLIPHKNERIWYASMIIIAANAGGAWTPIGDVTTTMLWIGKKLTAIELVKYVSLPSVVCFVLPTLIASYLPVFKGHILPPDDGYQEETTYSTSRFILILGLVMIVCVPVLKALVDLPPFLGMMFALAVVWLASSYSRPIDAQGKQIYHDLKTHEALHRIDMPSILFFLGILMAVGGLESLVYSTVNGQPVGTLRYATELIHHTIPNDNVVVLLLGVLSAIIDNVPLVAATMGMYDYPIDAVTWHFIAYSAGTGGSMLIIGSAAGVAAMGMENIDFIWYLKRITWLAALGFLAGAGVFLLLETVLFVH